MLVVGLFGKKQDPLQATAARFIADAQRRAANGFTSFDISVMLQDLGDRRLDDGACELANQMQDAGFNVSEIVFDSPVKATLYVQAKS